MAADLGDLGSNIAPDLRMGVNNHNLAYLGSRFGQFLKIAIFVFSSGIWSKFPLYAEIGPT